MRFIPAVSLVRIQLQPPTARWSRGLRHRPFTAVTRVRISSGSPKKRQSSVDGCRFLSFSSDCLFRRKGKGKYSCAQNKPTLIGFADKGRLAVYINACRTIQKYLNQVCWCKLLNCSGDNQWILTVKTKVLTHKIEILTRFYIIALANAIIQ